MEDMVTEPPAMEDVVIKLLAIEEETRVRQESIIETITKKQWQFAWTLLKDARESPGLL